MNVCRLDSYLLLPAEKVLPGVGALVSIPKATICALVALVALAVGIISLVPLVLLCCCPCYYITRKAFFCSSVFGLAMCASIANIATLGILSYCKLKNVEPAIEEPVPAEVVPLPAGNLPQAFHGSPFRL